MAGTAINRWQRVPKEKTVHVEKEAYLCRVNLSNTAFLI
jgi:hypothetical protein